MGEVAEYEKVEPNSGSQNRTIIRSSIIESRYEQLQKSRIIFVQGVITLQSVAMLTADVLTAGFEKDDFKKPVWVVINSPGGDVYSGLAIHDLFMMMRHQGLEVYTVAYGVVASIAMPILQAGTRRFSLPNAHMVIHQVSLHGLSGPEINQLDDEVKNTMRVNNRILKIIAERCGVTEEKLAGDSNKKDVLFSPEEAMGYGSHGLIDEIIPSIPFPV